MAAFYLILFSKGELPCRYLEVLFSRLSLQPNI